MRIFRNITQKLDIKNPIVTQGTFDGVHVGHRSIIERLNVLAALNSGESVLITFHPHPRKVINPEHRIPMINTFDEKLMLLESAGLQNLIIFEFTHSFSQMESNEFIQKILVDTVGTHKLVIGYNHFFGRNREGSYQNLKNSAGQYGFDVEEIAAQEVDHINVSSTKIRKAIELGDIETANKFLGYTFSFQGKVIHGEKMGRVLGFPTANLILPDPDKIIPTQGVYVVEVIVEKRKYFGMLNIGGRPTIKKGETTIEVHIFNFSGDLYGALVTVSIFKKIRDTQKFPDIKALQLQLLNDKSVCLAYFNLIEK